MDGAFDKMFYVPLKRERIAALAKADNLSIQAIMASYFGSEENLAEYVSSSSQYYVHLCKAQKVLIVLDGLDEMSTLSNTKAPDLSLVNSLISSADHFRNFTQSTILVTTRPEALFNNDLVRRGEVPPYSMFRIQPIEADLESFLSRWQKVAPSINKDIKADKAKVLKEQATELFKKNPMLKLLAREIDYIHLIMEQSEDLKGKEPWDQMDLIIRNRVGRARKSHWDRDGIDWDKALSAIAKVAYDVESRNLTTVPEDLEVDALFCSGLCDFGSLAGRRYAIIPEPVKRFLTVKHCLALVKQSPPATKIAITEQLTESLLQFRPASNDVIEFIRSDFEKQPRSYLSKLHLIVKLFPREKIVDILIRHNNTIKDFVFEGI